MRFLFLIILILVSTISSINAQSGKSESKNFKTVLFELELAKPFFENSGSSDGGISHTSVFGYLKAKYYVSENIYFFGDIPFSHYEYVDGDGAFGGLAPHSTIGNTLLGAGYVMKNSSNPVKSIASLHLRLPAMQDPDYPKKWGFVTGFVSDFKNKDSFAQDNLTIGLDLESDFELNQSVTLRLGLGEHY